MNPQNPSIAGRARLPAVLAAAVALAVAGALLSGPSQGQSGDDKPLTLTPTDPLGQTKPRNTAATYGSAPDANDPESETRKLQNYLRGTAETRLLKLSTDRLQKFGRLHLGSKFRVHSSLVWTEENRFTGALSLVVPLRDTGKSVTFLQPSVTAWNGNDAGTSRDRRTDASIGVVQRFKTENGNFFGGSLFFDSGKYSHRRVGVGLDYQIIHTRLSANYYHPLSDSETGFVQRREHALRGGDISLEQGIGRKFSASLTAGLWEPRGAPDAENVGDSKSTFKGEVRYHLNSVLTLRGGYEWSDNFLNTEDGYNLAVDLRLPARKEAPPRRSFSADPWKPVRREARILVARAEDVTPPNHFAAARRAALLPAVAVEVSGAPLTAATVARPSSGRTPVKATVTVPESSPEVVYAIHWNAGAARLGVDFNNADVVDTSGASLTGEGANTCATVPADTNFAVSLDLIPVANADVRDLRVVLTPVASEAGCAGAAIGAAPGGAAQGLVTVLDNGAIEFSLILQRSGTGADFDGFVSAQRWNGASYSPASQNRQTLTPASSSRTYRVFVSGAAGTGATQGSANTPAWPAALDGESVRAAVTFRSAANPLDEFGAAYTVTGPGSPRVSADRGEARYIVNLTESSPFAEFTVTLADDVLHRATDTMITMTVQGLAAGEVVPGTNRAPLDAATLTLSPTSTLSFAEDAPETADEGARVVRIPVEISYLPATPPAGVTFTATAAGTATVGTDYTFTTNTVTFTRDDSSKRQFLEVTLTEDAVLEADETIIFTITPSSGYTVVPISGSGPATHTLTIEDNEAKPSLSVAAVSVAEGGRATLTATLSGEVSEAVNGTFKTVDGTGESGAVGGRDFTAVTNGNFTIPANETTVTFDVQTTQDQIHEGDETFNVEISTTSPLAEVRGRGGTARVTVTDDESVPSLSIEDINASESSGMAMLTVTMSGMSSRDVRGTFRITPGTARLNTDYRRPSSTAFEIPAGGTTTMIVIPLVAGTDDEDPETFTVTIASSNSRLATATGNDATATVTVRDSLVVEVALKDSAGDLLSSLDEDAAAGAVTIEVTLSADLLADAEPLPVALSLMLPDGVTATPSPSSLSFAAEEGTTAKTATFTLAGVNNSIAEPDRTVTVRATPTVSARVDVSSDAATATLTLADDDADFVALTVTPAPATVAATGSAASTLTGVLNRDIRLASAGDTAVFTDTATRTTLTFTDTDNSGVLSGGELTTTASFDPDLGGVYEFSFRPTSYPAGISARPAAAAARVTATSTLAVAAASEGVTANEGASASVVVNISPRLRAASMVNVSYADTTAVAGTDYTRVTTLALPANRDTAILRVPVINDAILELDETFTVSLEAVAGEPYTLTANAVGDAAKPSSVVTITDTDALTLSVADVEVSEGGGTADVRVTMSGMATVGVTVTVSTADGTAMRGDDYAETGGGITIPAGMTGTTVMVPILEDTVHEDDETFTVTIALSLPPPRVTVPSATATATVTITENDPVPTLSIADLDASEGSGTATLTVMMSGVSSRDVAGTFRITPGTAGLNTDYRRPASTTFTIPAGSTTTTIAIPLVGGNANEDPETFTVTIRSSNPRYATATGADAVATVTVRDSLAVLLTLKRGGSEVSEFDEGDAAGSIVAEVGLGANLLAGADLPVVVSVTAPSGVSISSQTVMFSAGQGAAVKTLTFTIPSGIDNNANDPDRMITFTANPTVTGGRVGEVADTDAVATLTVKDDDPAVTSLATSAARVVEGQPVTVTVMTAMNVNTDLVIPLVLAGSGSSAAAAADITGGFAGKTVTVPAGMNTGTATVGTVDDSALENNEDFTVNLGTLPRGAKTGISARTVTIDNNDRPTLSVADVMVDEDVTGGEVMLVVTLSAAAALDVAGTWSTTNGTAIASGSGFHDNDFTAVSNVAFSIPAGQTTAMLAVTVADDDIYEQNEDFTVRIATTQTNVSAPAGGATATVTIRENDPLPNLSVADAEALEVDGSVSVVATLDRRSHADVPVSFSITGGTAEVNDDYRIPETTDLFIRAGDTTATLEIPLVAGTDGEDPETFTVRVRLFSGDGARVPAETSTATVTVRDSLTVNLALLDNSDDSALAMLSEDAAASLAVKVSVTLSHDLAAAASPLPVALSVVLPSSLTVTAPTIMNFMVGEGTTAKTATFTIPAAIDNSVIESADRMITVTATPTIAGGRKDVADMAAEATLTVTDDDDDAAKLNIALVDATSEAVLTEVTPMQSVKMKASLVADGTTNALTTATALTVTPADFPDATWGATATPGAITIAANTSEAFSDAFTVSHTSGADGVSVPKPAFAPEVGGFTSPEDAVVGTVDLEAPVLSVVAADATKEVTETEATRQVTVMLESSAPLGTGRTVTVAVAADSDADTVDAVVDSDYTNVTTADLADTGTSHSVMIPILGDTVIEPTETFVVTISSPDENGFTVDSTKDTSVITVKDNDIASLSFSTDPATPKAGEAFTISATIDKMVQAASNPVEYTDSANESYLYFEDSDSDGVIGKPESERTVSVEDGFDAAREFTVSAAGTFTHTLLWIDNDEGFDEDLFPDQTASISVLAADAPTIGFMTTTPSVTEGDTGTATLTLTIVPSKDLGTGKTVNLAVENTAAPGDIAATSAAADDFTDYTMPTTPVNLAASGNTTVTITVNGDNLVEADETFVVVLKPVGGDYGLTADKEKATVTITDNDTATVGDFTSDPAALTPGASYTLSAALDNPIQYAGTTAATGILLKRTGTSGVYFWDQDGDGYISDAELTEVVRASATATAAETFTAPANVGGTAMVAFSGFASDTLLGGDGGTGFFDSDGSTFTAPVAFSKAVVAPDTLQFVFDPATTPAINEGADADVMLSLQAGATTAADTLFTATPDSGSQAEPSDWRLSFRDTIATQGEDGAVSLTLPPTAMDEMHDLTIEAVADGRVEQNDEESLTLDFAYEDGSMGSYTFMLADTDTATLKVTPSSATAKTGEMVTFTGELDKEIELPPSPSTVDRMTFTDTTNSLSLVFIDMDSDRVLSGDELTETADWTVTGSGEVSFSFSTTTFPGMLTASDFVEGTTTPATATVTVEEVPILQFASDSVTATIDEDGGRVLLGLTMSGTGLPTMIPDPAAGAAPGAMIIAPLESVRVTANTADADTASRAGADRDYVIEREFFPLDAGSTEMTLPLRVRDDDLIEDDETFTVTLQAIDGAGYTVGARDTATITITDDDDDNAKLRLRIVKADGTTTTEPDSGVAVFLRAELYEDDGDPDTPDRASLRSARELTVTSGAFDAKFGITAPAPFKIAAGASSGQTSITVTGGSAMQTGATIAAPTFAPDIGAFTSPADAADGGVSGITIPQEFVDTRATIGWKTSSFTVREGGSASATLELSAGQTQAIQYNVNNAHPDDPIGQDIFVDNTFTGSVANRRVNPGQTSVTHTWRTEFNSPNFKFLEDLWIEGDETGTLTIANIRPVTGSTPVFLRAHPAVLRYTVEDKDDERANLRIYLVDTSKGGTSGATTTPLHKDDYHSAKYALHAVIEPKTRAGIPDGKTLGVMREITVTPADFPEAFGASETPAPFTLGRSFGGFGGTTRIRQPTLNGEGQAAGRSRPFTFAPTATGTMAIPAAAFAPHLGEFNAADVVMPTITLPPPPSEINFAVSATDKTPRRAAYAHPYEIRPPQSGDPTQTVTLALPAAVTAASDFTLTATTDGIPDDEAAAAANYTVPATLTVAANSDTGTAEITLKPTGLTDERRFFVDVAPAAGVTGYKPGGVTRLEFVINAPLETSGAPDTLPEIALYPSVVHVEPGESATFTVSNVSDSTTFSRELVDGRARVPAGVTFYEGGTTGGTVIAEPGDFFTLPAPGAPGNAVIVTVAAADTAALADHLLTNSAENDDDTDKFVVFDRGADAADAADDMMHLLNSEFTLRVRRTGAIEYVYSGVSSPGIPKGRLQAFRETDMDDGSVRGILTITLPDGILFAETIDPMVDRVDGDIPDGLTVSVTRTDDKTATMKFDGQATTHARQRITDIQLAFSDMDFRNAKMEDLAGAVKDDIALVLSEKPRTGVGTLTAIEGSPSGAITDRMTMNYRLNAAPPRPTRIAFVSAPGSTAGLGDHEAGSGNESMVVSGTQTSFISFVRPRQNDNLVEGDEIFIPHMFPIAGADPTLAALYLPVTAPALVIEDDDEEHAKLRLVLVSADDETRVLTAPGIGDRLRFRAELYEDDGDDSNTERTNLRIGYDMTITAEIPADFGVDTPPPPFIMRAGAATALSSSFSFKPSRSGVFDIPAPKFTPTRNYPGFPGPSGPMDFTRGKFNDEEDSVGITGVALAPNTAPSFAGATAPELSFVAGDDIGENIVLPEARGGNGRLVYSIDEDLPDGLAFDPETRRLSGGVAAPFAAMTFTLRAADGDTDDSEGDEATLAFTVTATGAAPNREIRLRVDDPAPRLREGHSTGLAFSFVDKTGQPVALGGRLTVSYTLGPSGMIANDNSRDVKGSGFSSVNVASGARRGAIPFTVVDDTTREDDETFTVTIFITASNVGGKSIGVASDSSSVRVTIPANDVPVTLAVTDKDGVAATSIDEDGDDDTVLTVTPTVASADAPSEATTFTVTASGTARDRRNRNSPQDYALSATELTLDTNGAFTPASITLDPVADDLKEDNETTTLVFTATAGDAAKYGVARTTITLNDNAQDVKEVVSLSGGSEMVHPDQMRVGQLNTSPISFRHEDGTPPHPQRGFGGRVNVASPSADLIMGHLFRPNTPPLPALNIHVSVYSSLGEARDDDFRNIPGAGRSTSPRGVFMNGGVVQTAGGGGTSAVTMQVRNDNKIEGDEEVAVLLRIRNAEGQARYADSVITYAGNGKIWILDDDDEHAKMRVYFIASDGDQDTPLKTVAVGQKVRLKAELSDSRSERVVTAGREYKVTLPPFAAVLGVEAPSATFTEGMQTAVSEPFVFSSGEANTFDFGPPSFTPHTRKISQYTGRFLPGEFNDDDIMADDLLGIRIPQDPAKDEMPSFAGGASIAGQTFTMGVTGMAGPLPEAMGGNPPLSYSLTPVVPGMDFVALRRTLEGAPTTAGIYNMVYKVVDNDGDEAQLTFMVTVDPAASSTSLGTPEVPPSAPRPSPDTGALLFRQTP